MRRWFSSRNLRVFDSVSRANNEPLCTWSEMTRELNDSLSNVPNMPHAEPVIFRDLSVLDYEYF